MTSDCFAQQALLLADAMYRVSSMLLRRPEDRQDAIQNCLLKAWSRQQQLRDMARFKPWIMRILVNECHTLLRKNRRLVYVDAPEQAADPPDLALRQCVEALPVKLREVVALHYMEGWPVAEVAIALKIPLGTVKSRLDRARKLLRCEWQEEVHSS